MCVYIYKIFKMQWQCESPGLSEDDSLKIFSFSQRFNAAFGIGRKISLACKKANNLCSLITCLILFYTLYTFGSTLYVCTYN